MAKERVHLTISGRVQGVGFRASTRRQANRYGLTGWVRNLANGDVEAVVEGNEDDLKELISWARSGPRLARVNDLEANWKDHTGEFDSFSVRY